MLSTSPPTYQPDHYRLLGVSARADANELKNSYRKLSRVFHPDRQGGSPLAADCFKQIASAYAELSDPVRRLQYDRLLMLKDPLRMVEDPRAERALDVLDQVVKRLRKRPEALPGATRGRDLRVQHRLPFAVAMLGGAVQVEVAYDTLCRTCAGQGTNHPERNPVCHVCQGHGSLKVGLRRHDMTCGFCHGRGVVLLAPCETCHGKGMTSLRELVPVHVPVRTPHGALLRVRGAGEKPVLGGLAGDLVVEVQVEPHPLLKAEGDDLVCQLPLTWAQAAGGCRVPVPTLEGLETLTIPPGTPTGRELRVQGRGLPSRSGRGALRVQVVLDSPVGVTPAHLHALRTLEATLPPGAFARVTEYQRRLDSLRPEAPPPEARS